MKTNPNKTTTLENRVRKLLDIAQRLEMSSITKSDEVFLANALRKIVDGQDPYTALDIKANRGEKRSIKAIETQNISHSKRKIAMGWIALAKTPTSEGGLGLTLEEACAKIGENDLGAFGLTEETLKFYWNNNENLRSVVFSLDP